MERHVEAVGGGDARLVLRGGGSGLGHGVRAILVVVVGLEVVEVILCCGQGEGIDRDGGRARRARDETRMREGIRWRGQRLRLRLRLRERERERARVGLVGKRLRLVDRRWGTNGWRVAELVRVGRGTRGRGGEAQEGILLLLLGGREVGIVHGGQERGGRGAEELWS